MHPCTTNSDKRVKTALLESHYKWWQRCRSVWAQNERGTECVSGNKAWLPSNVGEVLVPRKKEGGEGGHKQRENWNGAGRVSRVNFRWWRVKCCGSEIFFLTSFWENFPLSSEYNHDRMLLKRKHGRRWPERNLLPLRIKAAFYGSQFGDNIQLEAFYKAFMDGTGKCGKGPSL